MKYIYIFLFFMFNISFVFGNIITETQYPDFPSVLSALNEIKKQNHSFEDEIVLGDENNFIIKNINEN